MQLQTQIIATKQEQDRAAAIQRLKPPKTRSLKKLEASERPNLLQFGCLSGFQYQS